MILFSPEEKYLAYLSQIMFFVELDQDIVLRANGLSELTTYVSYYKEQNNLAVNISGLPHRVLLDLSNNI
jgi:hypothetical protein